VIDERIKIEHFAGYARRMSCDVPFVATTHKHNHGHWSILESGSVIFNGVFYCAPAVIWTDPSEVHEIKALSGDVKWLCVHVFPMDSEEAKAIGVTMDEVLVEN